MAGHHHWDEVFSLPADYKQIAFFSAMSADVCYVQDHMSLLFLELANKDILTFYLYV